jgi:DNA-binding response OmpR family regulator
MKYQFSDCVLDSEAFSRMRGGARRASGFDLLLTLVRKPGVVLTRDDLIEAVWGVGVLCRILRSARVFQRRGVLLETTGPGKASFGRCRGGGFSLWLTYLVKRTGVPRSLRD